MPYQVATREQWLEARIALLKEEKELTRRSDELAKKRQQLRWVRIDKEYRFDTASGSTAPRSAETKKESGGDGKMSTATLRQKPVHVATR